jgi:membrane-associated protease RseP (regulator of RpoE activity)
MLLGSLALLVTIWGILGWFDLESHAEAGFQTNSNNLVVAVEADSPAAEAGLQVGDQILKIAGYAAEDARSQTRLPRMKAGDTRVFTVQRADEGETSELEVSIAYVALSRHKLALQRASTALGFCFLLFPLLAVFRVSSNATRMLAVMGIGLSMALLKGPFISDASVRAMTASISSLFVLVGMAALVQFLLIFPRRRAFLDKAWAKAVIYLPALLLWLILAWRLLFTPPASAALNTFNGLLMGIVEGGYFLIALFLLLHNYSRTDRGERKALGLNVMLWGTVLGLLPAVIGLLTSTFSPQSALPGQAYYFLSLALIPMTWARSASRA